MIEFIAAHKGLTVVSVFYVFTMIFAGYLIWELIKQIKIETK